MREVFKMRSLKGLKLKARDGDVGVVKYAIFDDHDWTVRYLVVSTGVWFLGRDMLISPHSVIEVDKETENLVVALSCQQIKDSPELSIDCPPSRQYEDDFHDYYGLNPYWLNEPAINELGERAAARLHSDDEVTGYAIKAADGEIGTVSDFLIDDGDWTIRYIEVDTGNLLAVRHVLLAPAWVGSIDGAAGLVRVPLKCDAIRSAPEYLPGRLLDRDYEIRLFAHYGKTWKEYN